MPTFLRPALILVLLAAWMSGAASSHGAVPISSPSARPAAPDTGVTATHEGALARIKNLPFTNGELRRKAGAVSLVVGDRKEYWADDETGQFYITLAPAPATTPATPAASSEAGPPRPAPATQPANDAAADDDDAPAAAAAAPAPTTAPSAANEARILLESEYAEGLAPIVVAPPAQPIAAKFVIELFRIAEGKPASIDRAELANPLHIKSHVMLLPQKLAAGDYQLSAWLEDAAGGKTAEASWAFKKSEKRGDLIAFPADGLPITIEPIADTRALKLPMKLSIPLPRGAVKDVADLKITRHGKPVLAQTSASTHWGVAGASSVRWALAQFAAEYENGKAEGYRLELKRAPAPEPGVNVTQTAEAITVDNGTVKFVVNKKRFTGIAKAWFDASGKGQYDAKSPVLDATSDDSGAFLMDERLIKFTASADPETTVIVEEAGPQSVTILATGWYTDALKRVAPLCQYQVRLTLSAGQPEVRVAHNTVLTYDTRLHKLRNLGFGVTYDDAQHYAFGVDGAAVVGNLPQTPPTKTKRVGEQPHRAGVFMHQKTWELCSVQQEDGKSVDGKKSDGWAASWSQDKPVVSVTLRDTWEKFPKELEARQDGLLVHAWPKNGKRVFNDEQELDPKNIYKFWCFHQHLMLDLNLPQQYYEKLMTFVADETKECRPEHALNGNGQGMTIGTRFAVRFSAPVIDKAKEAPELVAQCRADAKIFELDPYAALPAAWNAQTQAVEPMAHAGERFKDFEETILKGLGAYNGSAERAQEYGMFIWPDTHTYWLMGENRASLHRVWQNSHYHQVGNSWVLWFRSGAASMLRWARENSDHFRNVGTIAYAEPESRATSIMFHLPGAMYHCKGCTPWGSETTGMIRKDTHAGIWGHWVDPDAHLWAWLMDGDQRARDLYMLWLGSMKTYGYLTKGTRREANNTVATLVTAYEATGDADFIPAIWTLGHSLRTGEPLEAQNPGPLWHPLWINRYYHLTRDPEYVPFILKYGRSVFMGNTWTIGLGALAHELSGDKTYLTQHLPAVNAFPRRVFRAAGHPYDYFGMGPGPLGMNWAEMGVGAFMRELDRAGIREIPADLPRRSGTYPVTLGRKPQSTFYAYTAAGGDLTIKSSLAGVEGDINKGEFVIASPEGKSLDSQPVAQSNSKRINSAIKASTPNSIYTVRYDGYGTPSMGTTGFDAQASMIDSGSGYGAASINMMIEPIEGEAAPATITFGATQPLGNDRAMVNIVIKDAGGATVHEVSLHAGIADHKSETVTIDPAKHPLPWNIDGMGAIRFSIKSDVKRWIIAPTANDIKTMKPMLEKWPGGKPPAVPVAR